MAEDWEAERNHRCPTALEKYRKRIAERSVLLKAGEKGGCLESETLLGWVDPEPVN